MIVAMVLIAALSTGDHTSADAVAESRRMMRINDYAGWETWEPPAAHLHLPPAHHHHQTFGAGVEQWRDLVARYFAQEDVDTVLCLMVYESNGDPNAHNPTPGSTATGLMQIVTRIWSPELGIPAADFTDPEINISAARRIRDIHQGWDAWSPYNGGLCHGL